MSVEAMSDLDHWHPLDPACTFEQYAARFPFCGPSGTQPPLLRVEDTQLLAGENLRAKSFHYRSFLQDREVKKASLEDLNTDRQAFAYACYLHPNDGNSTEWRPCIARRDGGDTTTRADRSYRVAWAFTPNLSMDQCFDEGSVLLVPREPEILDTSVPEHQELLASAQEMSDAGKSHKEIATALNTLLEQKMGSPEGSIAGQRRPPPITAALVRNHLRKQDTQQMADALGHGVKRYSVSM